MMKEKILEALKSVIDPDLQKDIVSLGMVQNLEINGNKVSLSIVLTTPACPLKEMFREQAINAIKTVMPNAEVDVNIVSNTSTARSKAILGNIKNIIAVVSGKGGVGKSTIATNLAVGLAQKGAKVGFIDADIHGPSAPLMFGLENAQPEVVEKDGKQIITPLEKFGVKIISMGFFIDPDKALIWRGPMIGSAFRQIMDDSQWGDLDYLIIDTPPGTGDIHLTLVQNYSLTGVVIVTTPQKIAINDAVKAINMFQDPNINVPILGIVENMSYFIPPDAPDKKYNIFSGRGSVSDIAKKYNMRILGQIPIDPQVCDEADNGRPAILNDNTKYAEELRKMVDATTQAVAIRNATLPETKIVEIKYQ
jgi:ATP-binding protein involved in chromosome partitioning